MPGQRKVPYGPSEKRELTRTQNREKIEAAAWRVFARIGLDGASVRDIVAESQVSPGSFYNYYGTKEAVFETLIAGLVDTVRACLAQARSAGGDQEAMLERGYRAFMDTILALEGGAEFFERNQQHIRSRLFGASQIRALMDDIAADVAQFSSLEHLSPTQRQVLVSVVFATGTEAIFGALRSGQRDAGDLPTFLARLLVRGIAASTAT